MLNNLEKKSWTPRTVIDGSRGVQIVQAWLGGHVPGTLDHKGDRKRHDQELEHDMVRGSSDWFVQKAKQKIAGLLADLLECHLLSNIVNG